MFWKVFLATMAMTTSAFSREVTSNLYSNSLKLPEEEIQLDIQLPTSKQNPTCKCGVTNRERIVGGEEIALARKYPWQVSLNVLGNHFCGGTIINDQWILTARHCFLPKDVSNPTFMDFIRLFSTKVVVGEHIRNQMEDNAAMTKNYSIKQIINHPNFSRPTMSNDMALLELTEPIPFGDVIRPICLPEDDRKDYAGETGTALGWGLTSNDKNSSSDILKELKLPILDNSDCKKWNSEFSLDFGPKLPSTYICAGGDPNGSSVCAGDSGGPLLVFDETRGRYVQVGVASFAKLKNETHFDCDNPDYPGVYARVSDGLKWISETTSNGNNCN